jgi:rRNA-processing protein FCF1
MKIILDANFLVYCAKQKIDYIREISNITAKKIVVLSPIIKELEKLKKKAKKSKDKETAELALQILKKNIDNKKIKIIKTKKKADRAIKEMAGEDTIIATMDRELKKQIKGKSRILSIRQKKKIEIL